MSPSPQSAPEDSISPTEVLHDSDQNVPVIAMDGNDLEAAPGNVSSPELSKDYLFPPGLDAEEQRHAFVLSDVVSEDDGSFGPWPQDLAGVDINMAQDGTYIETSSGPAARELKRRYDQRYGVSVNVRSPYAITAFVNQHGKQMFRVGHRELSAPAASAAEAAAEVEGRLNQPKASSEVSQSPPRSKRRSRMSMVALFPPNPFMVHRPAASSSSSAPKKLRKARSISDMASIGGSDVSEHGEVSNGPPVPTHNGRAHSQSVTAMDMPRFTQPSMVSLTPRNSDIFGDVMDWFTPSSSAASFSSQSFLSGTPSLVHTDNSDSRPIIAHPFGVGVTFETPLKKPSSFFDHLPPPRHVRLMQSFESGMTARQDDLRTPERPSSAIRITEQHSASRPSSTYEPPAEASLLSEYAATVFDVLQTYRGLPNLDKLVEHDTTVKISLSNDLSAVPRDDPRFVIWGEPSADYYDFDVRSSSRDSITSDSVSRRRGSKASRAKSPEPSNPPSPGSHRVLLAATIERWIAQLTSDLNYDELLDFFLTYRTYISGVDLAHLLISRFQWALQVPKSKQDQSVRQVVRVRTFVAIRYWLLTFFAVDFIPNRELRLLMSNWLNTLVHDPLLKQHSDGLGIARRLVKVAKDCKRIHIRSGTGGKDRGKSPPPKAEQAKSHLLGQKFAEAVMKEAEEDSDVDLDFLPDEAMQEEGSSSPTDHANAHIAAGHVGALAPNRPTSLPLSSFNILQRIDQAPVPTNDAAEGVTQLAIALPMHNSALSRAFVKTIGRLGRLRRVLHSRSNTRTSLSPCTGVSAFDLELSVSRDLLAANGGVEQYLKGLESRQGAPGSQRRPPQSYPMVSAAAGNVSPAPSSPSPVRPSPLSPIPQEPITPTTPTARHMFPQHVASDSASTLSETAPLTEDSLQYMDEKYLLPTPPPEEPDYSTFDESDVSPRGGTDNISLAPSFRPESIRSFASSTGSLGEVLYDEGRTFFRGNPVHEPFDVVSLDDFDMSDTSSEVHGAEPAAPPGLGVQGLRKQARKLPMRKDFEFLPRRSEISSMGIVSRASVVSDTASSSGSSVQAAGVPLGGGIQQWQMNALLDSLSVNEEDGDVDSALKRLEGQINPQKMQEKRSKVDGWVRQIQARLAAGDYEDEEPRFPVDSDEEDGAEEDDDDEHESVSQHNVVLYPPGLDARDTTDSAQNAGTNHQGLGVPPVSSSSSSDAGSNARSEDAKPAVEDVVPIEILRSRVSTILPPAPGPDFPVNIQSKFAAQEAMRIHQSFILSYRAVTVAEQFAMIDRELFMGVKFEELVTEEQWMATEEVNVYDWSQYLKDRATWKAEHRNTEKTTALAAVRARFNLMANFVISEIVLTQPNQRPMVVAKFIRVAWKSYQLSNFHGLVAIIAALKSDVVSHAMRKPGWNKVGSFETRVYRDLKLFVSGASDFALIRSAVEAIVENKNKSLDNGSHTNSIVGSSTDGQSKGKANAEPKINTPTACVPFIGIYLAQLHRLKRLPDLVDPTSPNETVGMNSTTGDFDPPAHPEVFDALSPLPPTMRIEPLVNVHKQRKIAAVIKSLVAGQHVASRVNFELDKKLFQRCLRLRALEPDMVQRALAVYD